MKAKSMTPLFFTPLWQLRAILGESLTEKRVTSRGLASCGSLTIGLGLFLYLLGYPMEYHQADNIYSLACVVFSIGASTLILGLFHWLQDGKNLLLGVAKPLTDCGRASFAICFWRYPLIYNPLIYLGLALIFPVGVAATLSVSLLLPTWLFAVAWIKIRRRFSLQIYGR